MGKAERNRERNARERIAVQQAAVKKAERRRVMVIGGGSVAVVLAIVLVLVGVYLSRGHGGPQGGKGALPASVHSQVTSVPVSTLAKVGAGALPAPNQLPIKSISATSLTSAGKPEMLYIGAEFCPFCAAMRWSMAVALSRFGSFGPFTGIHSSSTDTDPNTATLTFNHQQYTSRYLTFVEVENQTIARGPLQPTTKAQQALWVKYDSTAQGVGYPFIDFGGKAILTGPLYDPGVLKGLTWSDIAGQLSDPNSTVAKNVNGAANYVTAAICKMTNNIPSKVCSAAPIPSIEKTF